jgi:DNA/RNA-binding domain of Phe-tRNA-synthetase-like protein
MLNPVFRLCTPADLGLRALAFTLHGLDNRQRSPALENRLRHLRLAFDADHSAAQQQGFDELRYRLGRSPQRFPASPRALLEQFRRSGGLRPISPLVDLYNQWSLNSGLSIGAHDLELIQLPVDLAISQGGELFQGLGSSAPSPLPAGEYAYFDGHGRVLCRMDYRQAEFSTVGAASSNLLLIVQGHASTTPDYLQQVAEALKDDLLHCCAAGISRVA